MLGIYALVLVSHLRLPRVLGAKRWERWESLTPGHFHRVCRTMWVQAARGQTSHKDGGVSHWKLGWAHEKFKEIARDRSTEDPEWSFSLNQFYCGVTDMQ